MKYIMNHELQKSKYPLDFSHLNCNVGADIVFKFGQKFCFKINLRGKKGDNEKHEVCHILLQEFHSFNKFFEHLVHNHIIFNDETLG